MQKSTLTSCLALAAAFGVGMAAAPFSLDSDLGLRSKAVIAQSSGADSDAGATTEPTGADGSGPGVADERATAATGGVSDETEESVYEILGTTKSEAESADMQTSASSQYGPLDGYQTEVERGNLDAAAEALAAIAEDPVTEKMVTEVNDKLGVETTLSAQQIAEAAAEKQDSSN